MKQLLVLAGCIVVLAGLAGCKKADRGVEVIVESGDEFPEFLAGTWKADKHNWQVRFEGDGRISSIVHVIWPKPIDVDEGGLYVEGPEEGMYAMFVTGPCEAEYDENTRELSVKIILEHYDMKLPRINLEGKSRDYFTGFVSEDGNTWKAGWKSHILIEGVTIPDPNMIEAKPVPLVFTKVDTE
jgi:hypothetical protein